jgi:predicted TIM-barrel fold metal-dependent hydrolase
MQAESMKDLVDVHVHAAAFPDGRNGCLMSSSFRRGLTVRFIKWKMGLTGQDPAAMNRQYVERMAGDVRSSKRVSRAVVLAFDGVYAESGQLDLNRTTCLISNDFVHQVVEQYPDLLLLGASINPQRRDALDELDRVEAMGTKLIKFLPNSQAFDPADSRYKAFYRALGDKKIPLLSHVGAEHSFTVYDQSLGFPEKLRTALEAGATVIGAHGCGSNSFAHRKFYEVFVKLMSTYPNFYVDLSALSLPLSAGMVFYLRRHPEYFDRYLFGTDYPLSAYATSFLGRMGLIRLFKLGRIINVFDKHAAILESLGLRFSRSAALQRLLSTNPRLVEKHFLQTR